MMKTNSNVRPRAALLIGAALFATPAFAQDAQPAPQVVTPPPIMVTPAPAPAPAAPERVIQMAPASPVVQATPPRPAPVVEEAAEAGPAAAAAPRRVTQTRRTTTATTTTAPAPAAQPAATNPAAPAPAAQPAAPAETTAIDTPASAADPAPAQSTTLPVETAERSGFAWPWLLGGVLLVLAGAAALLLMRRRRDEPDYVEDRVYAEPEPVLAPEPVVAADPVITPATPIAAAPIAATPLVTPRHEPEVTEAHVEAELAQPESDELAGVADTPAPVANRPWIEFGLRPVRAGTSDEEALVDVELTVGNAGDTPAQDVRISTFMLADAEASEMEALLTENHGGGDVPPVTIQPGDGTRVDAHLAVPKGELGRVFNPVVVAEARYRLPDGSEGRTSAAFRIGRPAPDTGGVGPIGATRPHMVDEVAAELVGTPEHA
jgi:hypothetical protein